MDDAAATNTQPTDDPFAARRKAVNEIQDFQTRLEARYDLAWDIWKANRDDLKKNDPKGFEQGRTPGFLRRDVDVLQALALGEFRFLNGLVAKLAARIDELEQQPSMKYCGVYDPQDTYTRGEFVTHNGSLWHCWDTTNSKPGSSDKWQLAVKQARGGHA